MKVRSANNSDNAQIKNLWGYCLGYSQPFLNWSLDKNLSNAETIIIDDDNKILATSCSVPYTLSINEKQINSGYLCGIATYPEKRGMGFMKKLLKTSINAMSMKNQILSLVVPFNYKCFEKYGFRTTYMYKQYNITMKDIPSYTIRGNFERVSLSEDTFAKLQEVYQCFTKNKNGYIVRTLENWRLILEDLMFNFGGYCAILSDDDNMPVGYIMYLIHGNSIKIYEMAYTSSRAYESLFAFIKNHNSHIENVSIKAPSNDLSHLNFCDKRDSVTLCPFVMARITNCTKALEFISSSCKQEIRIQVIDRFITENNAIYKINEQGVLIVDDIPDITIDIGTLTQLFMGSISVCDAISLNMISGNGELLHEIFQKRDSYINMLCM